jgi:glucosamine 6-phosphate synthetase-like amidotransferase/phosphosugar isomerase protein
MCGIAGMSLSPRDQGQVNVPRLASAMLRAIEARGRHATGVAYNDNEGSVWYDKAPMPGSRYAATRLSVSPLSTNVVLHTRYATGGWAARPEVNENNHPFALPGVTGIHNGVLRNPEALFSLAGVRPSTGTDSEALFAALAYRSSTRADVLRRVDGDASVAWIETDYPDRLYLARLEGRPLAVARTPRGSTLFASTVGLLVKAAREAGVRLGKVYDVPEWTYLVIDSGRFRRVDRLQPIVTTLVRHDAAEVPVPSRAVNPALRLGVK